MNRFLFAAVLSALAVSMWADSADAFGRRKRKHAVEECCPAPAPTCCEAPVPAPPPCCETPPVPCCGTPAPEPCCGSAPVPTGTPPTTGTAPATKPAKDMPAAPAPMPMKS